MKDPAAEAPQFIRKKSQTGGMTFRAGDARSQITLFDEILIGVFAVERGEILPTSRKAPKAAEAQDAPN